MLHDTLAIDCLIFKNAKAFGYQEYLFNLLDYFYEHRSELEYRKVIVACPASQVACFKKYADKFDVIGFNAESKAQHLLCQQFFALKLHLKKDDAILFTYNYSPFLKICRHILVVHDLLYLRKNYLPNKSMRIQRRMYLPHSVKTADKIVAISEFTKNDICRAFKTDERKIEVIYNYFNFSKYEASDKNQQNQIEKADISRNYILSICSGAAHKNTISVLRAFEIVAVQNSDICLYFVGGITEKTSECFAFYSSLDEKIKKRIKFFYNISNFELGILYRNARLFISATLFEGLGMPIVEALYFNVPVLLSNIEICREVAGEKAVYFEPLNIDDILQKIMLVISSNEKKTTQGYVLEKFSENATSAKYIELVKHI